jgi:putative Mg2+ transporter-C (MgtC) family protein
MVSTQLTIVLHVLLAFGLTFAIGFERELRGSPAGDRTFSLIGVASGVIGALASQNGALSILSGAVTGVGFIGAGMLFRPSNEPMATMHGVTTAATIIAAAGIGAAAGEGELWLAVAACLLILLILELRYIPGLRILDARRWADGFKNDADPHHLSSVTVTVTQTDETTLPQPNGRAPQAAGRR